MQTHSAHGAQDASALRHYLGILGRRRFAVIQAVVLVPLAAVFVSLSQQPLYEARAEILLSDQNLAASLTGVQGSPLGQDPNRIAETQARVARVPALARQVLDAAQAHGLTPEELLSSSKVSPAANANILEVRVTNRNPALANRLATEYARQFTNYRRRLDTTAIDRARQEIRSRIDVLKSAGQAETPLYSSLVDKEQQLRTMAALQTSNASLLQPADGVVQVQPQPYRNGILGLVLGLFLGVGLAFLWEALDTRIRSAEAIASGLGLPLLGRIAAPPRRFRRKDRLVMLEKPQGAQAEGFRMLKMNLDFANLDRGARTIMFTSSVRDEGKSTTIANLAVTLARSGALVMLVDLDLRRPILHRFFNLDSQRGLTGVALGHLKLDEAIHRVAIGDAPLENAAAKTNGMRSRPSVTGVLEVLPAGPIPPDAGEFVGTRVLAEILERLRERADVILIDAPPLLHVGDPMTLSSRVDAIVMLARLSVVRRPMLKELRRILDACPAAKLGLVATAAGKDADTYAGYYGYFDGAVVEQTSRAKLPADRA